MEFYSAVKKEKEILPFETPRTNLEITVLSERQGPYDFSHTWNLMRTLT